MNKYIEKMTGFKATDKDLKCKNFQFELNKWYEIEDEIIECQKGFHFCEQLAGVFNYYQEMTSRVFKIEAEQILDTIFQPGSDYKRVCKKIRLVEEIKYDNSTGNSNTGNSNTGNSNTGDGNATNYSTGFFCMKEPKVICFDIQTKLSREDFYNKYPEYYSLSKELLEDEKIDYNKYKNLPGITKEKLKKLHDLFIEKRKK